MNLIFKTISLEVVKKATNIKKNKNNTTELNLQIFCTRFDQMAKFL